MSTVPLSPDEYDAEYGRIEASINAILEQGSQCPSAAQYAAWQHELSEANDRMNDFVLNNYGMAGVCLRFPVGATQETMRRMFVESDEESKRLLKEANCANGFFDYYSLEHEKAFNLVRRRKRIGSLMIYHGVRSPST